MEKIPYDSANPWPENVPVQEIIDKINEIVEVLNSNGVYN